ncbi:50S ribosome-binding GTPase [Candidatus Woesearchaeota archaeon]|nr:50S ribosome-binding GTPase [Candidatus Woesearchaeota archaeon]
MSREEQIAEIEEEIRTTKYNKATQHHIGLLKAKLARLRTASSGSGRKGSGYSVRKSGDATVVLVGFPSVGKSTILNKITNADSKIADYDFTTLTVIPGTMEYNHARVQVLDIPGLIEGAASGAGMGKEVLSVVRSADLIVFITTAVTYAEVEVLGAELYKAGFRLDETPPNVRIRRRERGGIDFAATVKLSKMDRKTAEGILREFSLDNSAIVIRQDITADELIDAIQGNCVYVPSLIVVNKCDAAGRQQLSVVRKVYPGALLISAINDNPEKIKKAIYDGLKLIRIYLKEAGKKADTEIPLIAREGSTIADVCVRLHKDFLRKFKSAKVWGRSARFPGQLLHEKHVLQDKDVVQINFK